MNTQGREFSKARLAKLDKALEVATVQLCREIFAMLELARNHNPSEDFKTRTGIVYAEQDGICEFIASQPQSAKTVRARAFSYIAKVLREYPNIYALNSLTFLIPYATAESYKHIMRKTIGLDNKVVTLLTDCKTNTERLLQLKSELAVVPVSIPVDNIFSGKLCRVAIIDEVEAAVDSAVLSSDTTANDGHEVYTDTESADIISPSEVPTAAATTDKVKRVYKRKPKL